MTFHIGLASFFAGRERSRCEGEESALFFFAHYNEHQCDVRAVAGVSDGQGRGGRALKSFVPGI